MADDRVIVCGSRSFRDHDAMWKLVKEHLNRLLALYPRDLLIVHGACPTGADEMAERWCALSGVRSERHPADWKQGRKAGPLRNRKMAQLGAKRCVAFWNGVSRGTRSMLNEATAEGIKTMIVREP